MILTKLLVLLNSVVLIAGSAYTSNKREQNLDQYTEDPIFWKDLRTSFLPQESDALQENCETDELPYRKCSENIKNTLNRHKRDSTNETTDPIDDAQIPQSNFDDFTDWENEGKLFLVHYD